MKFTIPRDTLLAALAQVIPAIERASTMPILGHVRLQAQEDSLELTGTDLELELSCRVALDGAVTGDTTLPARKLHDILRALPSGALLTVDITDGAHGRATLSCPGSRFTLSTLPSVDFPVTERQDSDRRLELRASMLREMLRETLFAAATQHANRAFNGVLLDLRGTQVACAASDTYRLSLSNRYLPEAPASGPARLIIPRKTVAELLRLIGTGDDLLTVEVSPLMLRVVVGSTTLVSRLVDAVYPDIERVIPATPSTEVVLEREAFRSMVQRTAIVANADSHAVTLDVSRGVMRVACANKQEEHAEDAMEAEVKGASLQVSVNAVYLGEALANLPGERVAIAMHGASAAMILLDADGPSPATSRQVVMPLRL